MKVRILSDLHLNFSEFEVPIGDDDKNTILVLAGDICEIYQGKTRYKEFFKDVTDRFKLVLYVFGNHEYYGTSYLRAHDQFLRECGDLDRLKILKEEVIEIDGVVFIGTTLWSDMDKGNPLAMTEAKMSMNDYFEIRTGNCQTPYSRRLLPSDTLKDHYVMKTWLWDEVAKAKQANKKIVVVTHHHPSYMSISDRYKGDSLNGCYTSEMFDEIYDNGPEVWLCGHMHNIKDYMINNTRIICNPRGYVSKSGTGTEISEQTGFDPNLTFEI